MACRHSQLADVTTQRTSHPHTCKMPAAGVLLASEAAQCGCRPRPCLGRGAPGKKPRPRDRAACRARRDQGSGVLFAHLYLGGRGAPTEAL